MEHEFSALGELLSLQIYNRVVIFTETVHFKTMRQKVKKKKKTITDIASKSFPLSMKYLPMVDLKGVCKT